MTTSSNPFMELSDQIGYVQCSYCATILLVFKVVGFTCSFFPSFLAIKFKFLQNDMHACRWVSHAVAFLRWWLLSVGTVLVCSLLAWWGLHSFLCSYLPHLEMMRYLNANIKSFHSLFQFKYLHTRCYFLLISVNESCNILNFVRRNIKQVLMHCLSVRNAKEPRRNLGAKALVSTRSSTNVSTSSFIFVCVKVKHCAYSIDILQICSQLQRRDRGLHQPIIASSSNWHSSLATVFIHLLYICM